MRWKALIKGTMGAIGFVAAIVVMPIVLELVAYLDMSKFPTTALSSHARLIMTYAMCGLAVVA